MPKAGASLVGSRDDRIKILFHAEIVNGVTEDASPVELSVMSLY